MALSSILVFVVNEAGLILHREEGRLEQVVDSEFMELIQEYLKRR